jgi:uncharacterized membrane protein
MPETKNGADNIVLADSERWSAALGYVFLLCFYSLHKGRDSDFVRFHARQGVVLFVAECIALALILIVDKTIGRIPLLGLLVVIILPILFGLPALFLAVMGFVKAFFGERWRMPFLGKYAERASFN